MVFIVAGTILYVIGLVAYPWALRRWWSGRRVPFNSSIAPRGRQRVGVISTGVVGGAMIGIGLASMGAWPTVGALVCLTGGFLITALVPYWEVLRRIHNRKITRATSVAVLG